MKRRLSHLLDHKGRDVYSVPPDAMVFVAIEQMATRGVGALLVMESERLVGVISERDYARKVILAGRSSRQTPVREIMSHPVITVPPDLSVREAMSLMTEKRVRHLPVVADERVEGVISIGDVVRAIIADQKFHIRRLEEYITGRR